MRVNCTRERNFIYWQVQSNLNAWSTRYLFSAGTGEIGVREVASQDAELVAATE